MRYPLFMDTFFYFCQKCGGAFDAIEKAIDKEAEEIKKQAFCEYLNIKQRGQHGNNNRCSKFLE